MGVPHEESMEKFYEGKTVHDTDLSTNAAWLPPTPGRRNWKTQMHSEEVERFEAVAGDLLEDLGFERVSGEPSRKLRRHVNDLQQQFAGEIGSHWQLPESWWN